MSMLTTPRSSLRRATWSGRPGTQATHQLERDPLGLRVIEHRWDDETTATIRVVEGDGRDQGSFRTHLEVAGVEPGQGSVLAQHLVSGD